MDGLVVGVLSSGLRDDVSVVSYAKKSKLVTNLLESNTFATKARSGERVGRSIPDVVNVARAFTVPVSCLAQ